MYKMQVARRSYTPQVLGQYDRELHCSLSSVPVFSISTFFPSNNNVFFRVEFHMLP